LQHKNGIAIFTGLQKLIGTTKINWEHHVVAGKYFFALVFEDLHLIYVLVVLYSLTSWLALVNEERQNLILMRSILPPTAIFRMKHSLGQVGT
jgi:hypothetical protein